MPKLSELALPSDYRTALDTLVTNLPTGPVTGVLLHGPVVRGQTPRRAQDVGMVVVVSDTGRPTLDAITAPLLAFKRALGVEAMVATAAEVRAAADVFPTRFAIISSEHVVLRGESPFDGLTIPTEHLRLRVEQELRTLTFRLRRRYINAHSDAADLAGELRSVAAGLSLPVWGLLKLQGTIPASATPEAVLSTAGELLGKNSLAELARLHAGSVPSGLAQLFGNLLDDMAHLAEVANDLEAT